MSSEQQPAVDATTTMAQAAAIITRRFDLDAFTDALKDPSSTPVTLRTFEQMPALRRPGDRQLRLYDTSSGGFAETPLDSLTATVDDEQWEVYVKREDQHPVGSYKLRVARMAIIESLSWHQKPIFDLASAGNFAASAAYTVAGLNRGTTNAAKLHVNAFCKADTSPTKLALLEKYKATTHSDYFTLEEAMQAAAKEAEAHTKHTLIHPFDSYAAIAGSITATLEYFAQLKTRGVDLRRTPFDLYEPIGGGGKMAAAITGVRLLQHAGALTRDIRLIGVETERNDSAYREVFGHTPLTTESDTPDSLDADAEGVATLRSGRRTVPVIARESDLLLSVPKHYVVRACGALGVHHGFVPELAGAMSFAGFLYTAESDADAQGRTPLTTTTGRNVTAELLERVCSEAFAQGDFETRRAVHDIRETVQTSQRAQKAKEAQAAKAGPVGEPVDDTPPPAPTRRSKQPRHVPGRAPLNVFGLRRDSR